MDKGQTSSYGRQHYCVSFLFPILRVLSEQVYDIAFSRAGGGRDMFASVGADGSVRMFDLRHLEHSTIIYEDPQHHPLLRLCWNKQDPNYLATMAMDGMEVRVFFEVIHFILYI